MEHSNFEIIPLDCLEVEVDIATMGGVEITSLMNLSLAYNRFNKRFPFTIPSAGAVDWTEHAYARLDRVWTHNDIG